MRLIRRPNASLVPIAITVVAMACVVVTLSMPLGQMMQEVPTTQSISQDKVTEETQVSDDGGDTIEHFHENMDVLLPQIAKADAVTLYEGMPRVLSEQEASERGVIHRKPVMLHEFAFYDRRIPVTEDDAAKLIMMCSQRQMYGRYTGPKFCGGFHPDWCIEFKNGESVYQILVCFGCDEARVNGPMNEVFSDVDRPLLNDLKDILKRFVQY